MRLLLVEDEIQLSEALNQILTKNKYVVDAVYNGEDGLDYGLTDIYDVIILDIMLPKLNGLEILRRLRKNNTRGKKPKHDWNNLKDTQKSVSFFARKYLQLNIYYI